MSRLALLVLPAVFILSSSASAQQANEPPLITVSGQAEVQVAPDEVVFSLEVEKLDKELLTAKNQNDESVRQVLSLARRFNIEPQYVKTDYISVEPKYTTDLENEGGVNRPRVKREFIGYQVSKTIVIVLKDISRFEEFFSEVLKAGVSRVNNVEFRTSEIRKHKDKARAMAIKAAREKAVALTSEIGQTIGRAYTIQEGSFADRSALSQNYSTVVGGSFSDEENTTIAPGLIKVRAQVTVRFRLE
jgi:uncharacterized protein YggE